MKKLFLLLAFLLLATKLRGAPAYVTGAGNACTAVSCAATLTSTKAGDLIVLGVFVLDSTSVSSVTDTQGNTYTLIGSPQTWSPHGFVERLYYAKNIKGGANSTTVTLSASKYHELYLYDYSGLDPSAPVDVSATPHTGTGTSGTSGAVTTTNKTDLLFAFFHSDNNAVNTPGTGWTGRNVGGFLAEDQYVTSTGTYSATMSFSLSADYVGFLVAFKAAAGTHAATLNWTDTVNPAGSVSYNIYRASVCTATFAKIASAVPGFSYVDSTIAPQTSYCYRITALATAGGTESLPCAAVYLPGSVSTCNCQ